MPNISTFTYNNYAVVCMVFLLVGSSISNVLGYVFSVFLIFYFFKSLRVQEGSKSALNLVLVLTFVCLTSLALSYSPSFILTVEFYIKFLCFIIIYHVLNNLENDYCIKIVKVFTYVVVLSSLLLVFKDERLQGIFTHANHLAYTSCILVVFKLYYLKSNLDKLLIFLLSVIVLLTKSSGGMLTLLSVFNFYLIFKYRLKYFSIAPFVVLIIYLLTFTEVFALLLEKISFQFDFYELQERAEKGYFGLDGSFVWRLTYWIAIIQDTYYLDKSSIFFGIGFGSMTKGNYFFDYMITDPHNDFVKTIAESGLVFGSSILYLYFKLCENAFRSYVKIVIIMPMLVGNILVNIPFLVLAILLSKLMKIENTSCK